MTELQGKHQFEGWPGKIQPNPPIWTRGGLKLSCLQLGDRMLTCPKRELVFSDVPSFCTVVTSVNVPAVTAPSLQ